MLDANPESIVHFPLVPMEPFNRTLGAIPVEFGGGNRYRVIWAPSRKVLRFTSGISETISAYGKGGMQPVHQQQRPGFKAGECWILEGWLNPYRDCTEEEYNTVACVQVHGQMMTRLQVNGPFPRRGYYWHCENTYLFGEPSVSQVERQILLVEDGMFRYTEWDKYCAIRRHTEAGEKNQDRINADMLNDRKLIGGGEAFAGGKVSRGSKTIDTKRTTLDLQRRGFSTKPGTASATPRGKKLVYDMTQYIK